MLNLPIPLHHLHAGESAQIRHIDGNPEHAHRLEEFGFRTGVHIEMFRPGNPCIVRLGGNKVCLRADKRLSVFVSRVDASCKRQKD